MDSIIFSLINGFAGQSAFLDALAIFFAVYAIFILAIAVGATRNKKTMFVAATSIVIALVSEFAIQLIWHRQRPFVELDILPLISPPQSFSFPSTHASISFALAQTLFYFDKKWGTVGYVLAALISLSRVFVGVHYPSDILAGALLGILSVGVARMVLEKYQAVE